MGEPTEWGKNADNTEATGNNYKNKVLGYAVKDGIQWTYRLASDSSPFIPSIVNRRKRQGAWADG